VAFLGNTEKIKVGKKSVRSFVTPRRTPRPFICEGLKPDRKSWII